MKSTYIIIAAIVVIIIVIGGVFAYISLSNNSTPSPTPTPTATPTASPTSSPSSSPTSSPSSSPTSSPTSNPTASPTATPTATPTPTVTPTPTLAPATIQGSGGSLVNPIMQTWIPAYEQAYGQIQASYNSVGSGTGITQFQQLLTNFGETDVPLQASEISGLPSGTTALTIPISASAIVPAYNIQLINGSTCQNGLNFTGSVLANIFLGTITKWNDPQIANLQSADVKAQLPSANIVVVHRADSSGTMYAFTDYLTKASSTWASQVGTSKKPNWPVGLGYNLNSGVAAGIVQNPDSIGPLEIAYEIQVAGQISYGTVQNAAGNYILPSTTSAQAALAAGASTLPAGNATSSWSSVSIIDNIYGNTSATTAYPITTMTYALLYQEQHYASFSAAQAAATVNFLYWIVNNGQSFGPTLGYVPLPSNIVALDNATLKMATYSGTQILH